MQYDNNQSSAEDLENLWLHELVANNDVKNLTSKISSLRLSNILDIDKRIEFHRLTPLNAAAFFSKGKSHFKVAEILLNNGADPNAEDWYDNTPLWYFIRNGSDVETLKLFSRFKADFTRLKQDGSSLLIPAVHDVNNHYSLDVLKFLVQDIGLDVNHKDECGVTPLHHATEMNKNDSHYEVIKFLLEIGADPNAQDSDGKTSLFNVIRSGNLRVFELFLSNKAKLGVSENILFEFVNNNSDVRVLEKLFSLANSEHSCLDVNQKDNDGRTPLHHAAKQYYCRLEFNNTKVIEYLLKKGANANALDNDGVIPLVNAVPKLSELIVKDERKASHFADFLFEQTDFSLALKGLHLDNHLWKLILKHLAKLTFLSIPVHPTLQESIEDDYKGYFENCTQELKIMSRTKPQNSWISFINLLVDDRRKLKNYAGNEDLMKDFINNDWLKIFPIYGDLLKRNVDKGLRRRKLFDKSAFLLSECLPIFNPNHLIVEHILDCVLSKKILSNFCESDQY